MFEQKKVYKSMENRQFTPKSLLDELEALKIYDFESISYTGISLNIEMLITQHLRDDHFQLIEARGGLAKKSYDLWHKDLCLAIEIYNQFAAYTQEQFDLYIAESTQYQKETGYLPTSAEYKAYFEQGNAMYFHDMLHIVFDLSRKIDLSIEDFIESLEGEHTEVSDYPLPEKRLFEGNER